LLPTIESRVLKTLKNTIAGNPPSAYQNSGLTNPSVRFSLMLSMAA